jgi:hypothetical protein
VELADLKKKFEKLEKEFEDLRTKVTKDSPANPVPSPVS